MRFVEKIFMSNSIVLAFKNLDVSGSTLNHENIYEVSYQYLSKIKQFKNPKAFNNCIVALINLDKYDKALEIIDKVDGDIKSQYFIEVAYVYYKTNNSEKLYEIFDATDKGSSSFLVRGLKHIVAQDYYRNGEYEKALEVYQGLVEDNNIDSKLDLIINELAVLSQLKFFKSQLGHPITIDVEDESHDLSFNKALIELGKGNLLESLVLVDRALDQLPDMDIDDMKLEKYPILLVKSFILLKSNRVNDGKEIIESLKHERANDFLIDMIVKNNNYAIKENLGNVNLIQRDLNYQQNNDKLSNTLPFIQYNLLVKNNLLLLYLSHTLSKTSNYLSPHKISKFANKGDYSLLAFKALTKLNITNDDLVNNLHTTSKKLFKFGYNTPITNENFKELVAIALILLSINLKEKKYNQSLMLLSKLVEFNLQHSQLIPGLIGSLIQLYETLNLNDVYYKLLINLTDIIDKVTIDNDTYSFFKVIGMKLFGLNDEACTTIFHKLLEIKHDTLISNIVNKTQDSLLPIEELVANVDESVLSTNIDDLIPSSTVTSIKPQKVQRKKSKTPKFSKNKVLKSEVPQLDPERWLPMRLRSYYKPKKSKKNSRGHQGTIEVKKEPAAAQSKPKKPKKKKGKN